MIPFLLTLFSATPWPGQSAHPRTLADVLCALDRRPRLARIAAEVGR